MQLVHLEARSESQGMGSEALPPRFLAIIFLRVPTAHRTTKRHGELVCLPRATVVPTTFNPNNPNCTHSVHALSASPLCTPHALTNSCFGLCDALQHVSIASSGGGDVPIFRQTCTSAVRPSCSKIGIRPSVVPLYSFGGVPSGLDEKRARVSTDAMGGLSPF